MSSIFSGPKASVEYVRKLEERIEDIEARLRDMSFRAGELSASEREQSLRSWCWKDPRPLVSYGGILHEIMKKLGMKLVWVKGSYDHAEFQYPEESHDS